MSPIVLKREFIITIALCAVILFLFMDRCGSYRKADELRGRWQEAIEIAKIEKRIKEEIIKEQNEKIREQDLLIAEANRGVEIKNDHISSLGDTVADLEEEFGNLEQQDAKIGNLMQQVEVWKEKFSISQSIISDKDAIIFSLTKKYDAQVRISIEYKSMGDSIQGLLDIRDRQVKELDKINKRLRFSSGLKSGLAVILAGLIIYNMVK